MTQPSDNSRSFPSSSLGQTRQVLLIDDDKVMGAMLAEYLRPEGFEVTLASNAQAGLESMRDGAFTMVILDVMLPDQDGFTILREIRKTNRIPIIMLTTRSATVDKVNGLEDGADDYMPKPFTPVELLARIRSILRRGQPSWRGIPLLAIDDLVLNTSSKAVECEGRQVECTVAEFDALRVLASSPGTVISRDRLTRLSLGRASYVGDRGIDNLLSSLRKKLGPHKNGQERFRSARNSGYIYLNVEPADKQ